AREHKALLYDFSAEWCGPCREMSRDVFSDRTQAGQIDLLYVPVRVLDRNREEGKNPALVDSLQTRYAVHGFPTLVVVRRDGSVDSRVGYEGRDATMAWLTRNAAARPPHGLRFRWGTGADSLGMPP